MTKFKIIDPYDGSNNGEIEAPTAREAVIAFFGLSATEIDTLFEPEGQRGVEAIETLNDGSEYGHEFDWESD